MQDNGKHMLDLFRHFPSSGTKLMMGLLKYNPAMRMTAKDALSSDYFTTLVCLLSCVAFGLIFLV